MRFPEGHEAGIIRGHTMRVNVAVKIPRLKAGEILRWMVWGVYLVAPTAWGQQAQNPSPMAEHTREHRRLAQETPAGRRESLELGRLFIPEKLKPKSPLPLIFFFHGGTWLPEVTAAGHGKTAVVSV